MDSVVSNKGLNSQDIIIVNGLKSHDNKICRQFFYKEIVGVIHKIRVEVFRGLVDFNDLVSELYIYLSRDNWAKLDSFNAQNGCRLRTWMIPLAWRYFINNREKLLCVDRTKYFDDSVRDIANDDLRIQIAIDVNAVLSKMPNGRYAEIIRLLIIEGFSAQDVADMWNMKVANVYNLKHRAIIQFVELYGR